MCCAALVLVLAGLAGPLVLGLALVVAGGILAWGWAGMLALPSPRGTSAVVLVGGLGVVLSAALEAEPPRLSWVPGALALALILAFGHQMLRVDGRPRIVESTSAVALALGVMTCGVLLIPLTHTAPGRAVLAAALAGAAASALTDTLGRWPALRPWLVPLALVAGGAAAAAIGLRMEQPWSVVVLVGVVSGAVSHAVRSVLCNLPTMAHGRPRLVMALASLLVTGPVAYAVALLLVPGAALTVGVL